MSAPSSPQSRVEFAVITVPGFGMRVRIQFDGTGSGWCLTARKKIGGLDQSVLYCSDGGRPPEFPDLEDEFEIQVGATWLKVPERSYRKLQAFVASVKGGAA